MAGKTKAVRPGTPSTNGTKPEPTIELFNASELMALDLPEIKEIVPGIITEGLIILAGKPKLGKSWMAFGVGVAVACGGYAFGSIHVEARDVLYIALEDGKRRLQSRLRKMLQGADPPPRMAFSTKWPRLDQGGVAAIAAWIEQAPAPGLIIIDTFARIRPHRDKSGGNKYEDDYADVEQLQELATQYGVAIVLIHHQRKEQADDPLDTISGTLGIGGAADGALVLTRVRGQAGAKLVVISRDLEEEPTLALEWHKDIAAWTIQGPNGELRLSPERQTILAWIRRANRAVSPQEIATGVDTSVGSVRHILRDLAEDGQVIQPRYGLYAIPKIGVHSIHSIHSPDSRMNGMNGMNDVFTSFNEGDEEDEEF